MTKVQELRIRLASLNKSPIFAKLEAAEELIECAVELLEQQEARITALERAPKLTGLQFEVQQ